MISQTFGIDLQYAFLAVSLDETLPKEVLNPQRELLEEWKGTTEDHIAKGGKILTLTGQGTTYHISPELIHEWPEVVTISMKLIRREELNKCDKIWIRELAIASGWREDDIVDELENISVDPSERIERYKTLFEDYYKEAQDHKERGDTRQAGEKIWGAVTALIKLYASIKGIPIIHWSISKLDSFIENNVEEKYRKLFRDLLDKAHVLHEHFYEGHLSPKGFEERWKEVVDLIEKVKEIVFEYYSKAATRTAE